MSLNLEMTFVKRFCCSLKKRDDYDDQMAGDDSYYDRPFKTEPEDFEEDEINDEDYYPNQAIDNSTGNVGRGEILFLTFSITLRTS